jgi:glycogen synthase
MKIAFNNDMAHLIEAGADMFLMPSRYEPCGFNHTYSLKYGTIPVVRYACTADKLANLILVSSGLPGGQ